MQRIATTVLALVGEPAGTDLSTLVTALGRGGNVRGVSPATGEPPIDRAVTAWGAATRTHTPYLVHDADPLADVADAWVAGWDDAGDRRRPGPAARGSLEVAVREVLRRWRAGALELPDYYLLVGVDDLGPTARHWYLGVLAGAAAHRVVVAEPDATAVAAAVRQLRAGRWWPPVDRLLDGVDLRAPDTVHDEESARATLL